MIFPKAFIQQEERLHFNFEWDILDVFFSNRSSIDLPRLAFGTESEARNFVANYGYDLNNPREIQNLANIKNEAIQFIQTFFIDSLEPAMRARLLIPDKIIRADVVALLLLASIFKRPVTQRWACAILRVMHTIAHVDNDLSANFFQSIQQQIIRPYESHIQVGDDGQIHLGVNPEEQVPLVEFQVRAGKERNSAILKLLHKAENVASDLFDRIGFRFITRDKLDALLVAKYLRRHVVSFPNIKPSRSVNTLVHVKRFRKNLRHLYRLFDKGEIGGQEFERKIRYSTQYEHALSEKQVQHLLNVNLHKSDQYRSIQFTVRQLVRIENPLQVYKSYIDVARIEQHDWQHGLDQAQPYYRFFFPYEVQVVDIETHRNNMEGQANHEIYKYKQLVTARQRIMGDLLSWAAEKKEPRPVASGET